MLFPCMDLFKDCFSCGGLTIKIALGVGRGEDWVHAVTLNPDICSELVITVASPTPLKLSGPLKCASLHMAMLVGKGFSTNPDEIQ